MAATYTDNGGSVNGSNKVFTYSFPVLQTEDIQVALNGVTQAQNRYTPSLDPPKITFDNNQGVDSTVQEADGAPKSGVTVRVYRETTVGKANGDEDPKAVFAAGSSIRAGDLNANIEQALFGIHEQQEKIIQTEDLADDAVTSAKLDTNIDIAGTLDVTGATTLDSTLNVVGTSTHATVDINGGAIDGTTIGANSAAAGTFTNGTIATADINGGAIDGTTIGASSAAAGTFTTVTASGTITGNVTGNITGDVTGDVTGDLTGNADTATALATGRTIASTGDVVWNSGSFDGTANKTAAATIQNDAVTYAKMQNVSATNKVLGRDSGGAGIVEEISPSALRTMINVEDGADVTDATNVDAAGAVMNSDLATKGTIVVGDGSGDPTILPVGTNNHVLVADSSEASGVKWSTVSSASGFNNVVEDTTPQLGGDLDVNGNDIVSVSNGNINITPNGSGDVVIDGLKYPQADGSANQFLKTNGSAQLSWADVDLSAKFTKAGDSITGDSTIVSGVTNKNFHIDINNADTLIRFDDDLKATFGDADDLQVYWDGTQGHIIAPSGRVDITADSFQLVSHDTGGRAIYLDDQYGRLELGHDGNHDATFNGGSITLYNDTTLNAQKDLRFADADSSNYVAFQAPATIGSNVTWTLPAADGSANQVLKTAGDGTLSWTTVSGTITALNNQAANRLTTIGSTTTQLDGEANLTFDGSTLAVTGNQTVSTTLAATGQIIGRGFECPAEVGDDWTIAAANNAFFPGPMTVAANKTVTVPAGRTLTIV